MADYISSHSGSQIDGAVDTVLNVEQTTGNSTTALMSQNAITTMFDSTIQIGNSANSGSGSNSIAIGNNAISGSYNGNIAIGASSNATGGSPGIALGIGTKASGINTVAIGNNAETTANNSVAIGAYSECTEEYTVSVGGSFGKRRIVNVSNPINAQDVVTKNYIDSKILSTNTTIYVNSATGNDTTGNGSQSTPYATISKAISVLPKIINATATISVSAGTYSMSNPNITGFSGTGGISIVGASAETTGTLITNALIIQNNTLRNIYINKIRFSYGSASTNRTLSGNTGYIQFDSCNFVGTAETALANPINLSSCNTVTVTSCNFNYCTTAISIFSGGMVIVNGAMNAQNGTNAITINSGGQCLLTVTPTGGSSTITRNTGGVVIYPNGTFTP